MQEPEPKRSKEELEDELSTWEGLIKSAAWDLLMTKLKVRHYSTGVALRRPASDIATILNTEGLKAALTEIETLMDLPRNMIETLKIDLKRSDDDDN